MLLLVAAAAGPISEVDMIEFYYRKSLNIKDVQRKELP
jgi:hypothetical protein